MGDISHEMDYGDECTHFDMDHIPLQPVNNNYCVICNPTSMSDLCRSTADYRTTDSFGNIDGDVERRNMVYNYSCIIGVY
jgi:hypothetical protein